MSWVAISDECAKQALPWADDAPLPPLLDKGAIVLEAAVEAGQPGDTQLLGYARKQGWDRCFGLSMSSKGALTMRQQQGVSDIQRQLTGLSGEGRRDIRVMYSWDAPRRKCLLSVENLTDGTRISAVGDDPVPIPADDVGPFFSTSGHTHRHPCVSWYGLYSGAFVDHSEPCLGVATKVMTPDGPVRAGDLKPGQMVLTADNGARPLTHVHRTVLPARGSFTPIRLRAPYFGLEADLIVAPRHRVVLSGSDVEYLFGEEEVLVEARYLIDGVAVYHEARRPTMSYVCPVLENHEILLTQGCRVESKFVAAAPGKSTATRPHRRMARRELHRYEALAYLSLHGPSLGRRK